MCREKVSLVRKHVFSIKILLFYFKCHYTSLGTNENLVKVYFYIKTVLETLSLLPEAISVII